MVDKRTSRLIVRTTPEELANWEAQAKADGVTLANMVRVRMKAPVPTDDTLGALALRSTIASLEGRIGELESYSQEMAKTLDARNARIAELEATIVHGGGLSSGSLRDDLVVPKGKKGARPAMAIDTSKPGPLREGLPGYRLTKSAVDPKVHHPSGPVLKSAVPKRVRGEVQPNFKPGQLAAQDVLGQAPSKGKGKR